MIFAACAVTEVLQIQRGETTQQGVPLSLSLLYEVCIFSTYIASC